MDYRLKKKQNNFGKFYALLKYSNFLYENGGPIKSLYFARLLEACTRIKRKDIEILLESFYKNPYSPEGLYEIFRDGIMPVPYLCEGREEFKKAIEWKTSLIMESIKIVDNNGKPIIPSERVTEILRIKAIQNKKIGL